MSLLIITSQDTMERYYHSVEIALENRFSDIRGAGVRFDAAGDDVNLASFLHKQESCIDGAL